MMSYEMLTGGLPFQKAKSPIEIINFHLKQAPPAPSKLRGDNAISPAVDAIILKMVAKSRDDRFADAAALRAELAKAQTKSDRTVDRIEAYRVIGLIATAVLVGALFYFLHH